MGPIDHSLTYKTRCWRNIPHRYRLKQLVDIIAGLSEHDISQWCYADFGCSNGYVTNLLTERFHFRETYGFDHNLENLSIAMRNYPNIKFEVLDLSTLGLPSGRYELVSCFETLEHVGNPSNALRNLLDSTKPGGILLISVPLEIGFWGMVKFVAKTFLHRSSFAELQGASRLKYTIALLTGQRVSVFREIRNGWGTHFGFDYREIEDMLEMHEVDYRAFNRFTTRFYVVTKK